MEKYFVRILLVFFIVVAAVAATTKQYSSTGPFNSTSFVTIPITADLTDYALPDTFVGGTLYATEVKCTDDDAIAFVIDSHNGTPLWSGSTSSAIAGQAQIAPKFYPINGPMTVTTTGYGDSTGCTMEVTLWVR